MAERASRREVIAFRLAAHGLAERSDEHGLLDTAGRCGIQNSPPGSALLALHARTRNVTPERMTEAVEESRSLLQSWSMRGSPFFFPVVDAPVFTTGVLPPTEEAMRHFVLGVGPAVDALGMSLSEAVELTGAEVGDVLAGRRLTVGVLGAEIAERIARTMPRSRRRVWEREGPYAPGQPLGEGVVHFCLRILTLRGVICFAPRAGNAAPFVLVDEWLGRPIPPVDPQTARAELLRRYLRCYGPSTRGDFAAWLGIRAGDAGPWWGPIEDELTSVEFGRRSWMLAGDLDTLRSAPMPTGVRLLPPGDPYTQLRDRGAIGDEGLHRGVWKTVGGPGTVLVDGEIVGTWRPHKTGRRLTVTIAAFRALPEHAMKRIRAEAEQIAPLRGASSVEVGLDDHEGHTTPRRPPV